MPQRAVIVANGVLAPETDLPALLRPDDLIVAVDGGSRYLLAAGVAPEYVVGDMDSLAESDRLRLEQAGTQFVRYPVRKDETDLELAIRLVLHSSPLRVLILGALGGRWDQTAANLMLLAHPLLEDVEVELRDGRQSIRLLRPGKVLPLSGCRGDIVSLAPLGGDVGGVRTTGLEWPLDDETLRFAVARGVSNVMTGAAATVTIREGLLLCVMISVQ